MAWSVDLKGHHLDLEEIPKWLAGGEFSIEVDQSKYYLRSALFNGLADPTDVRRAAEEVIELINGFGRLVWQEFRPIRLGAVIALNSDGTRNVHVVFSEKTIARDKTTVTIKVSDGGITPPQGLGVLNPWLHVAANNELVQRAISYLNRPELTRNDLYRALEVVKSDVGSVITERGWASGNQLQRFTRTANSYSVLKRAARHGRDRGAPPPDPIDFTDALELIREVVRRWIEDKVVS